MVANGNDVTVFVTRQVSSLILALSVAMLVWPMMKRLRGKPDGGIGG